MERVDGHVWVVDKVGPRRGAREALDGLVRVAHVISSSVRRVGRDQRTKGIDVALQGDLRNGLAEFVAHKAAVIGRVRAGAERGEGDDAL